MKERKYQDVLEGIRQQSVHEVAGIDEEIVKKRPKEAFLFYKCVQRDGHFVMHRKITMTGGK